MLTDADIEWIYGNRDEITAKRKRPVILHYEVDGVKDPWSGEIIGGGSDTRSVDAVVTELSSQAVADRILIGSAEANIGDIWFSVNIDLVADIFDKITDVTHDGRDYTVIAQDKKGIGIRNRVEFLGRRTT